MILPLADARRRHTMWYPGVLCGASYQRSHAPVGAASISSLPVWRTRTDCSTHLEWVPWSPTTWQRGPHTPYPWDRNLVRTPEGRYLAAAASYARRRTTTKLCLQTKNTKTKQRPETLKQNKDQHHCFPVGLHTICGICFCGVLCHARVVPDADDGRILHSPGGSCWWTHPWVPCGPIRMQLIT